MVVPADSAPATGQIVETLAHVVLGTPHLRTLVDPESPPEPPPPPAAQPPPANDRTLLDLWTVGPGAGGGASLRRGVLRDPITLTPASTKALAFLAEDRTHLSLSCADIMAVVQPQDGESFLSDFFKKELDRWGEKVAFMDPDTLHGARANRRLMEVVEHGTLFGEQVLHKGILWFLESGAGGAAEDEEWEQHLFFIHGKSRLSRLVRQSTARDAPAQIEILCDATDCTACVLRPRPKRPHAVCLRFGHGAKGGVSAAPKHSEMELAAENLADLSRWLSLLSQSSSAIARTSQLVARQVAVDAVDPARIIGTSYSQSRRQRAAEVMKQQSQVVPSGDHEVFRVGGAYFP
eukprot:CAMPEP_0172193534 /NCGR_PEP_ID=MMETSP1050-20130122/25024_1 /TAXON_ID=233186 /ORGANISM="Cryptomonas curvata, Strain CCAP979/52" /LENGTH=348 /DNA_ID=CAMNT_0012869133 /DNA_START=731 /DNA_END=1778 /DNA_ORIENTATION=+